MERKRCFLESDEWKTIPWAKDPGAKTPLDELHDILCDLPGFLEDIDRIRAWDPNEAGLEDFRASLCSRAVASLEMLYAWRWDWEQKFPHSSYIVGADQYASQMPRFLPPSPFSSIIWFANPHRSSELMTYNAIRVIISKTLEAVGVQAEMPPSEPFVHDPLLPTEGTLHDVVIEICRMVAYHLQPAIRSFGALMLIFPINIALRHLNEEDGEVKLWVEAVMTVLADLHGFELGRSRYMRREII